MKRSLLVTFVGWMLAVLPHFASAQELPERQSFGANVSLGPDSSHILIGAAERRRVWTAGLEYGRTIWGSRSARLDYEGSISPLFLERDPTVIGTITNGVYAPQPAVRPIYDNNQPIAYDYIGMTIPVYGVYGSTETYGFAASPLGARINGFNSRKVQPTFSLDLGMVFSTRDIPIDDSSAANFLFSFGPGVEVFYARNRAIRLEYIYRHLSNANSGPTNPGVDQAVIRLSLTERRR